MFRNRDCRSLCKVSLLYHQKNKEIGFLEKREKEKEIYIQCTERSSKVGKQDVVLWVSMFALGDNTLASSKRGEALFHHRSPDIYLRSFMITPSLRHDFCSCSPCFVVQHILGVWLQFCHRPFQIDGFPVIVLTPCHAMLCHGSA